MKKLLASTLPLETSITASSQNLNILWLASLSLLIVGAIFLLNEIEATKIEKLQTEKSTSELSHLRAEPQLAHKSKTAA